MNLVSNILVTFSARFMLLVLSLFSSIILARVLGPDGLGLFTLILLLPELVRTFGLLGFEQANAVYAGLEPNGLRALVWQSAIIATAVGGVTAVASSYFLSTGALGSKAFVQGPLWLYLLALSIIPVGLLIEYLGAILRGMNRIFLLNFASVGMKVASLVLVAVLVGWLRLGVAGAVWVDSLANVGTMILFMVFLRQTGAWGRPVLDGALLKRTGRFALPAYCGNILSYLNYRVDQFIIAIFLPPQQLSFYVIAVGLAERLWILTGAVSTALLPHLTHSRDRDPALAAVVARHVMVWTGAACFLLFGLADVVVRFLYSSEFALAVAPLRWLLPGIFISSIGKVLVAELSARKKIDYVVWVGSIIVPVNIVGNLLLLPRMGVAGAALASTISYSVLSGIVTRHYLRETGLSWTVLVPCRDDLRVYKVINLLKIVST